MNKVHRYTAEKKDLVVTTIKITREQRMFLEEHSEINLSGLVRRTLDKIMKRRRNDRNGRTPKRPRGTTGQTR